MAELLYFAKDGSYGSAADLTILSTEHWTDEDVTAIEEASDWARWLVAQEVHAEAVRRFLLSIVTHDEEAAPTCSQCDASHDRASCPYQTIGA